MKTKFLRAAALCLLAAATLITPAFAMTEGGAVVDADALNLRAEPSTASASRYLIPDGAHLLVEERLDGWYKVLYKGMEGYVCADYAETAETLDGGYDFGAQITGSGVRLRAGASTESDVLGYLDAGAGLTVLGVSGQWLRVATAAGTEGYVRSDYVSCGSGSQTASSDGAQLAETAKQYLGYSYKWGGMSPSTGFDCSGFVNYIYRQYGYSLERTAQDIYSGNGTFVSKDSLQPGDILCFGYGAYSITHVGIYIGGGKMVHASTSATGVITSDIGSDYYLRMYVGAKRVL